MARSCLYFDWFTCTDQTGHNSLVSTTLINQLCYNILFYFPEKCFPKSNLHLLCTKKWTFSRTCTTFTFLSALFSGGLCGIPLASLLSLSILFADLAYLPLNIFLRTLRVRVPGPTPGHLHDPPQPLVLPDILWLGRLQDPPHLLFFGDLLQTLGQAARSSCLRWTITGLFVLLYDPL